jgi:hypothetical protein
VVGVLRYKQEGHRIDSGWCHWNFLLTYFFWPHYGPGVCKCGFCNVWVSMCEIFNVWVCVCVSFVMCGCVCVWVL